MKVNPDEVTIQPVEGENFLPDARWRGKYVGTLDCPVRDGVGKIGNLLVPKQYRRMGFGTSLVQRAIEEARQQGLREIWGEIVKIDLDRFRDLPAWYEAPGFAVREPSGPNDPDSPVKTAHLGLTASSNR